MARARTWTPGAAARECGLVEADVRQFAEWFRTMDRLGAGGTRPAPPEELLRALGEYSDVFRLVTDG